MISLTKQEKESGVITTAVFAVVLLLLIVLKYKAPDKEKEKEEEIKQVEIALEGGGGGGGTMINFGSGGGGARYQNDVSLPTEEAVGSDNDDAEAVVNTNPVRERDRTMQNPKPETPRKPNTSAVNNFINAANAEGDGNGLSDGAYGQGGTGGGRGRGNGSGNGDGQGPGSGTGSGGGSGAGHGTGVGDYNLGNRRAINKPKPSGCNERTDNKVVLRITVDAKGKVIKADVDRGTTGSTCQIEEARKKALQTTFEAGDAEKQVGSITYNFKVEQQ
jgi:hypothetical protein